MKKLSTYLFLVLFSFSAPSFADDISEFQIEGMSIGDSLLDYLNENQIDKYKVDTGYKSDKYETVQLLLGYNGENFETYDAMHINFLKNDKKKIIHALHGMKDYDTNNIDECYKKENEISDELDSLFKNIPKEKVSKQKHAQDPSGKSFTTGTWVNFPSGDRASTKCFDWSEEIGFTDHLRVSIVNKKFMDFINHEAY